MYSYVYIAAVHIQNCFRYVLTVVFFVNHITNVLPDVVPHCNSDYILLRVLCTI